MVNGSYHGHRSLLDFLHKMMRLTVREAGISDSRSLDRKWKHLFSFSFSFFFLAVLRHMEFPGQGSDPSHNCNLSHSCSNAGSLTHCARLRIKPSTPTMPPIPCATAETPLFLFFVSLGPLLSLQWRIEVPRLGA